MVWLARAPRSEGPELAAEEVSVTRALRASVLRRAVRVTNAADAADPANSGGAVGSRKLFALSSVVMQTHKQAKVSPRRAWPNPSIERTPTSRLRLLAAASHVKR